MGATWASDSHLEDRTALLLRKIRAGLLRRRLTDATHTPDFDRRIAAARRAR